ncbi:glycoside hydrolase family 3 N-terminal domain-containing protein [Enterococcus faecalis]
MKDNKNQILNDLLAKMTLEEKIGQINQVGTSIYGGKEERYEQLVMNGEVGSFLSIKDIQQSNRLQKIAITETRLKIPLLFAEDVVHGFSTIFPIPLAESCSFNKDLMTRTAEVAAREASAAGIHWTFAPMIDVSRDPRWGRVAESFGEDTFLTAEFGAAKIRGFQGEMTNGLLDKDRLIACGKHFAGYSESEAGRDYNTVDMSDYKLSNVYLPPFKKLIDEGVLSVMSAFNALNGIPSTVNKRLLIDILRNKMGFNGLLISDWNALKETIIHGYCRDEQQAVTLAMASELDVDMSSRLYHDYLKELILSETVSADSLDQAVLRVLELKYRLGLFDNPFRSSVDRWKKVQKRKNEHRKLARKIAQESIVLLKNDADILPLKETEKVLFMGPLVTDQEAMLDTWACNGKAEDIVSVAKALNEQENYVAMSEAFNAFRRDGILSEDTIKAISENEKVVLVLGEKAIESGEAKSKASIELDAIQENFLKAVYQYNRRMVVVLMNGRPMVVGKILPYCKGLVEAWHLGAEAGNAILDVLCGKINPAGKLTITIPRHVGQIPIYYNYFNTGRPYSSEKFNTTKYLDVSNEPQFPFGYGLSYTTFSMSPISIKEKGKNCWKVTTTVSNKGSRDGYEVVQLYIGAQYGRYIRPTKDLVAYKKVFVKSGDSVPVSFELTNKDFKYYDEEFNEIIDDGAYWIMVGNDSSQALTNKAEIEVRINE